MSDQHSFGADDVTAIAAGVVARDRASIAAALNLVEDRRTEQRGARLGLLRALAASRSAISGFGSDSV